MRIATFNVQNLYHRDTDLIYSNWSTSLKRWMEEFEHLLSKPQRKEDDFSRMRELSFLVGFQKITEMPYLTLQRKGGRLYARRKAKGGMPAGPDSLWNGWVKLASLPIDEMPIHHKSQVICEGRPHLLLLQEIEDRFSLDSFVRQHLSNLEFKEQFFLDGNDENGRGMGLLLQEGYHLKEVRSHRNDRDYTGGFLFDKDIQEYVVECPTGEKLVLINCHLKEDTVNREYSFQLRKQQMEKIRDIYRSLLAQGNEKIIIGGTLNTVSYCDSISPLLREIPLKDISRHPTFSVVSDYGEGKDYHSLGAYGKGINIRQKDYLLFSPELEKRILSSGMNRKGMWPPRKKQWRTYSTLQKEENQASDHPLIWCCLADSNSSRLIK